MTGAIRVEVRRSKNESSIALIRRFSRRAKDASLVQHMRRRRYYTRLKSKNVERRHALVSLSRRQHYHELVKLGKIDPNARKERRRR
ncbi:MAG: hypothetical protein B7X04_03525 [Parcubacteria group bacterium 21-54-25]|nr:MAG: hypothetical protein B7X04_03525 [Parcubacteria group bacterium 21-54-25]HQU08057.1 hypothetical protein [Candidatus Paceibacterota bacterium]